MPTIWERWQTISSMNLYCDPVVFFLYVNGSMGSCQTRHAWSSEAEHVMEIGPTQFETRYAPMAERRR